MKERGMLFSAPMVRALLDGSKTQTRRAVKPQPSCVINNLLIWKDNATPRDELLSLCPYGQPGDRIWVREAIRLLPDQEPDDGLGRVLSFYDADGSLTVADAWPWRRKYLPPMHCPRGLSRIDLEITGVRVERLQDISEADAKAEGIESAFDSTRWRMYDHCDGEEHSQYVGPRWTIDPVRSYRSLWLSINGAGSWDENPWVWCISFRRIDK